jgi:hypothetical protein
LESHAAGTATITVRFAGLEDSEAIEVTEDNIPPRVVSAKASGVRFVEILFSEPVEELSGTDPANYSVSGPSGVLAVYSATRLSDQQRVILLVDPMPCEYLTATVVNVYDQSPSLNLIDPNANSASFMNFVPSGLKHRYTFNNGVTASAVSGTIIPDGVGSADGQLLGGGASFVGLNRGTSQHLADPEKADGFAAEPHRNRGLG